MAKEHFYLRGIEKLTSSLPRPIAAILRQDAKTDEDGNDVRTPHCFRLISWNISSGLLDLEAYIGILMKTRSLRKRHIVVDVNWTNYTVSQQPYGVCWSRPSISRRVGQLANRQDYPLPKKTMTVCSMESKIQALQHIHQHFPLHKFRGRQWSYLQLHCFNCLDSTRYKIVFLCCYFFSRKRTSMLHLNWL